LHAVGAESRRDTSRIERRNAEARSERRTPGAQAGPRSGWNRRTAARQHNLPRCVGGGQSKLSIGPSQVVGALRVLAFPGPLQAVSDLGCRGAGLVFRAADSALTGR